MPPKKFVIFVVALAVSVFRLQELHNHLLRTAAELPMAKRGTSQCTHRLTCEGISKIWTRLEHQKKIYARRAEVPVEIGRISLQIQRKKQLFAANFTLKKRAHRLEGSLP
jgi:hypothetical protein